MAKRYVRCHEHTTHPCSPLFMGLRERSQVRGVRQTSPLLNWKSFGQFVKVILHTHPAVIYAGFTNTKGTHTPIKHTDR